MSTGCNAIVSTIIKTRSVCDGDARCGWLAGDTDRLTGWPVTVGVVEVGVMDTRYRVSQPGADTERYRCTCLRCTQGMAGRSDGYQCGLAWRRVSFFSTYNDEKVAATGGCA